MRKLLEIGGIVAAVVLIAFGIAAIVLAVQGNNTVNSELKDQQITGTPRHGVQLARNQGRS